MDTLAPAPEARLLPSAEGEIAEVLFTFPAPFVSACAAVVADCLNAVPQTATVTVATHASSSGALATIADGCGRSDARILAADAAVSLSLWTQDVVTAIHGADPGPAEILAMVDRRHGRAIQPPVAIPGGNRLVAADRLLVGADSWDAALAATGGGEGAEDALRERVRRGLDPRPVLVVGTQGLMHKAGGGARGAGLVDRRYPGLTGTASRQPVYHLDMIVTLAGPSPVAPRGLVFVASPWHGGPACRFPGPVADAFEEIAADLAARGFEVRRLPIALVEDGRGRQRLLSWNNGWVEASARQRRAWVPRFCGGCPDLGDADEAAVDAWRAAGFETIGFAGAWSLAKEGGGLHCAGLVTSRRVDGSDNLTLRHKYM